MRNRFVISITTALVAVLLIAATGCKANPEKAKKKYLESGVSYVDKKQYDAAAIQFKKALQVDPNYAEAHYQLALTYLRQGKGRDGYLELRQAVKLDPNNMKARLELGNLLWAGKDFKGAEEQAHYVVEHDPNNADGYTLMGTTYFALRDTDQAMQAYNKVIELKPNDSGAYLNRGVLYASTKRDAEAEADFRKAIELEPQEPGGVLQPFALLSVQTGARKSRRSVAGGNQERSGFAGELPAAGGHAAAREPGG